MLMYMQMQSEKNIHIMICDYIRLKYPDVLFRTDLGGIKLTMGQAAQVKRMQGGKRAWPDLFIAEPRYSPRDKEMYSGLFIELKATNIYKKDGSLRKNDHLFEQSEMLTRLESRGYKAVFAVGFDRATAIIDEYLSS